jgi:hypothetical protein
MQVVWVPWIGPCLSLHPRNGIGVEVAEIGGRLRIEPAPRHHGRAGPASLAPYVVIATYGCKSRDKGTRLSSKLRKIINDGNALPHWHDHCSSPAAGHIGRKKQEEQGAAPLPLVSCGPSFVRPAIARFPMGETWTGIKESSNG